MKKVFWIQPMIVVAILLLNACKKEEASGIVEYQPPHWPVIKTLYVTNLTSNSATLNGTVNGYGLCTTVTFEYYADTSTNKGDFPISYSNTVIASQSPVADSGIVNVSADISGLSPCQVYRFRLKAENSLWEKFYGDQQGFCTLYDPNLPAIPAPIPFNPDLTYGTVSDINGNSYKTIQIGPQTWMAENLRTTRYADGTAIPLATTSDEWDALTVTGIAYCWNNWETGCDATFYGAYYTWAAAMNGAASSSLSPSGIQGVCPDGWHLPSDQEWTTLINYLGGETIAGGKLKETDTIHWQSPNMGATNESGFTAIASGGAGWDFSNKGYAWWWSSTDRTEYYTDFPAAVARYILCNDAGIYTDTPFKNFGFSVRCVKDFTQVAPPPIVITEAATNISSTGAVLNGTVNANGLSTTVTFEYQVFCSIPGKPFGWHWREVTAAQSPLTGTTLTSVSANVTGLKSGTTHPFRVKAVNLCGTVYGAKMLFTLP